MKSGPGDDLWGDDDNSESEDTAGHDTNRNSDLKERTQETTPARSESNSIGHDSGDSDLPYLARRAIQDGDSQFERSNRLTFFVRDEIATAEGSQLGTAQKHFGREIQKFDFREAAYRAVLKNPELIIEELEKMGYGRK